MCIRDILGIILSLLLLITMAYRGTSVVIAAPVCAAVAMVFSGAPFLATYTDIFMPALGKFITSYFPIFVTGAIFGRLMSITGYARAVAQVITRWLRPQRAILATVFTAAILTYGGVSVFVAVFVMFPLAKELFRMADLPRRMIPALLRAMSGACRRMRSPVTPARVATLASASKAATNSGRQSG